MKKHILTALFILMAIQGCSPRIVEQLQIMHDTTYVNHFQVDSIFRKDSIFIKEKNDTIYQYIERIRDRYRFIHDTTYISRIDTLMVTQTNEVKVEKPLTRWQRFRIGFGTWSIVAVLCGLVYLAVKKQWWVPVLRFFRKTFL